MTLRTVSDDEWLHVGTLHRNGEGVNLQRDHPGGEQRAVRDLLAAEGHAAVLDQDVRVDLLCGRDDALNSWLAVHVRTAPSSTKSKKKPRHKSGEDNRK